MSCYVMNARITFAARSGRREIVLRQIQSVQIETSWKLLTDTAVVTVPRKVSQKLFDKLRVRNIFRRGDAVQIALGYNGQYVTEFDGYITEVSATAPIAIKCEDEMWKLKATPVSYSKPSVELKQLLTDILPAIDVDANAGEQLGAVRFSETTASQVLEKLKQQNRIYSYFKGKRLVSGKIYTDDSGAATHRFELERNAVRNDLQYRRKEDTKILVIARAIIDGKKTAYRIGEEGGQLYRLNYTGHSITEADLKRKASADYKKLKTDGFDGSFTAFGVPSVRHGEKVNLTSRLYKELDGIYYIEGVSKRFGPEGYRQEIKLGGVAA
ncbi:MAG: hypothetical protein V6Z82_04745 [Flavobacteriales bacterium]